MAATPDGDGYWLVGADGGVFTFGNARFYGSTGGIDAEPAGRRHGVDARRERVLARRRRRRRLLLRQRAVLRLDGRQAPQRARRRHGVATPTGKGYWLVAADGGIFAFGDAPSMARWAASTLNAPVVGMAVDPDGQGYWLVAADGGIFTYGDARVLGSMGGKHAERAHRRHGRDPGRQGLLARRRRRRDLRVRRRGVRGLARVTRASTC